MSVELSEMSLEAVLRTYSSVKDHRTRCEREIENLLALLTTRYSSVSEDRLKERLESLEKHTLRLSDIKDYLVHLKYAKAKDHDEKVQEFLGILDRFSSDVLEILHNRHATAQVNAPQVVQQAAPGPAPKAPTSELKPEKLSNDASMATYRSWGKQFRAYFDAGRFDSLPCTQQQAFFNNCLDDVLRARINREASATTPVYSNVPGFLTCSRLLDTVFLETNPIHLRRKQFFDARQREGQTIIEFREELLSLIEEADGDNIGVNDLICIMLRIGASDPALRRELGAIKNPTLTNFNDKIEGFEQARKTEENST